MVSVVFRMRGLLLLPGSGRSAMVLALAVTVRTIFPVGSAVSVFLCMTVAVVVGASVMRVLPRIHIIVRVLVVFLTQSILVVAICNGGVGGQNPVSVTLSG